MDEGADAWNFWLRKHKIQIQRILSHDTQTTK